MGYAEFVEDKAQKIQAMEPMKRRFTAAAVGAGAAVAPIFGFLGLIAGMAGMWVSLDTFGKAAKNEAAANGQEAKAAIPEYLKNAGSMGAGFIGAAIVLSSIFGSADQGQQNEFLDPQGSLEQLEQGETVQFSSNGTAPVVTYQPV